MEEDLFNLIQWDKPQPQLQYSDYNNHKDNTNKCNTEMCKVLSECWFKTNGFENILQPLSREQKIADNLLPLSLNRMRKDQQMDTNLIQ